VSLFFNFISISYSFMAKQFINIVEISILYDILDEIKSSLSFQVNNYPITNDFLEQDRKKNPENLNSIIISKKNNQQLLSSEKINNKNLIELDEAPIKIFQLLDKINIHLIKKKYNLQSHLNIKDYSLNLNSRIITHENENLKLTEREIDIILFLNQKKTPQSIDILQNEVWKFTNTLETHTVETHIYRLRKKIKDKFDDDQFIISKEDGYSI
tara:strand:- start:439 stop:1077 length:639 start_codon:yes stop_codon:yes gene_type:complete